jgi:hypothetical protein
MSEAFGTHAVRLSAIAMRLLGWRPDDFWAATPAELTTALAPITSESGDPLARTDLKKMMELDNG